jgi:hypothetical protein
MPSVLNVDTLVAANGTDPVTLTKQSAAKAWATWNGIGTVALTDSFGTSSILDNTTGDYTLTLSSAMTNDDYSITTSAQENRCIGVYYGIGTAVTTTTIRFGVNLTNGSYTPNDPSYAHMMAMGDLA